MEKYINFPFFFSLLFFYFIQAGIAGALAKMTLGEPRNSEQVALEEHMRRQGWEQGQIDYMGRDSFENIWKKICNTLSQAPSGQPSPPKVRNNSSIKRNDKKCIFIII